MSRHVISTDPEVIVGWDHPLGTFFGQVFDEEGECIVSIGYEPGEVFDVAGLELWCLAVPNVTLPADVVSRLTADSAQAWEPGSLQKQLGFTGKSA